MNELDSQAFEFVLGTLPAHERQTFLHKLKTDRKLSERLNFWENQLGALNNTSDTLQPKAKTWQSIKEQINPNSVLVTHAKENTSWLSWFPWALSLAMSFALIITLGFGYIQSGRKNIVPVDYVAVLTDNSGVAKLTAITHGESKQLWLQWEAIQLNTNKDLQIWAISKRDQQIRSIAVLENQKTRALTLSEAHWRLIKDADSLILTEEEKGGSVLDEPSEQILAKGVCVRLNQEEKAS